MPGAKVKKAVGVYQSADAPRQHSRMVVMAVMAALIIIAVVAYLVIGSGVS